MAFTLSGGTLYDGLGNPGRRGNLVVDGDRIAAVGNVAARGERVDVTGLVVSPGFIDTHSHCDLVCMADRQLAPKLLQGITTDLLGQDGLSEAPIKAEDVDRWRTHLSGLNDDPSVDWTWRSFGDYFERVAGASINMAAMVGHGTVRLHVMGMDNRPPSASELTAMQALVDDALAKGACGFSTGLIYSPCVYADTEELIAFGHVSKRHDSFMVYHMRFEGERVLDGMAEVFRIARESGSACHISHFKARGNRAWGMAPQMVDAVEEARREGLDITADQYPYTAGSTMLGALLPPWCHARGIDGLNAYLRDETRERQIRDEIERGLPDWESSIAASSWDSIMISGVKTDANRWVVGKRIAEIAAAWGLDEYQTMVRLLLEEQHAVSMILFMMDEADVRTLLVQPWLMHCTDGLMGGEPHPRTYGTYPRVLGHYVREHRLMPLEAAIRKMTSLPAWRIGLRDRGELREGAFADITVFNSDTVIDRSTYEHPRRHPEGIELVFVNGIEAVRDGRATGNLAGRAVRREIGAPGTR
ncbi:MAG TPA: D-aminoacylase [Thermomicrobiales bacterium]|nr:D-aminoacylase [Thermomicrobiales bacterium]